MSDSHVKIEPLVFRLAAEKCFKNRLCCCYAIEDACKSCGISDALRQRYLDAFTEYFDPWEKGVGYKRTYVNNWGVWCSDDKEIEPRVMALLIMEIEYATDAN